MLQPDPKALKEASARDSRRARLLEEAAQEFNASGISGASLSRIARALGLTRAALYYYVKDRNALAAECYARTCDVMGADLAAARLSGGNGLKILLSFLRLSLAPDRRPSAVLDELDHLETRSRNQIVSAHARNIGVLREIIRLGIGDGSIRECDDEVMAQTLVGTIFWIPLSVDWVEGTDETYRARTVEALVDLVCNGGARDPAFVFEPTIGIESFFPTPANAFDRKAMTEAKIEQLLTTSSQMFNRRGIDGTSLDDITAALGATKGALYHYLDNKTELVVRCYRRAFALYERFAKTATERGRCGLERSLLGTWLNVQAHASGLAPLIQLVGVNALPTAARREVTRRARALQHRYKSFGEDGQKDGSYRKVDFDAVAQLGAGSFQWLPKWFATDDPRASQILAREIITFFIKGLRRR